VDGIVTALGRDLLRRKEPRISLAAWRQTAIWRLPRAAVRAGGMRNRLVRPNRHIERRIGGARNSSAGRDQFRQKGIAAAARVAPLMMEQSRQRNSYLCRR
jgi:hypothetical protein